jgi:hypothetical protein
MAQKKSLFVLELRTNHEKSLKNAFILRGPSMSNFGFPTSHIRNPTSKDPSVYGVLTTSRFFFGENHFLQIWSKNKTRTAFRLRGFYDYKQLKINQFAFINLSVLVWLPNV